MLRLFWRRKDDERGFTLIELLIVVAIIAILAAILIPNFLKARQQARVGATKANIKNLANALESYFVDWGVYPATAGWEAALTEGDYIRAAPVQPGGVSYSYQGYDALDAAVEDGPVNYVLCDNAVSTDQTDPTTVWYYMPGAGLGPAGNVKISSCPGP